MPKFGHLLEFKGLSFGHRLDIVGHLVDFKDFYFGHGWT